MSKVKQNQAPAPSTKPQPTHYRLCHVCLHLNEGNKDVFQCVRCNSQLSWNAYTLQAGNDESLIDDVWNADLDDTEGGESAGLDEAAMAEIRRKRAARRILGLSVRF